MTKSNKVKGSRQLRILRDEYSFLDEINDRTLFGHFLDHQETDEFKSELVAQLEMEPDAKQIIARVHKPAPAFEPVVWDERSRPKAKRKPVKRDPEIVKRRLKLARLGLRRGLRLLQHNKCFYCGHELTDKVHLDHRVPISRGGTDKLSNLVMTCAWCNQHKGVMSEEAWRDKLAAMRLAKYGES